MVSPVNSMGLASSVPGALPCHGIPEARATGLHDWIGTAELW